MDIQLNFIDRSKDTGDLSLVFYQKNVAASFQSLSVAWKVISHCGSGNNHPFVFPTTSEVAVRDAWGNFMPRLTASEGQLFSVRNNPSGNELGLKGKATSPREIQVQNDLIQGVITAAIFRDNRPAAVKTMIAPGQKAVFQFKPVLFAGFVSQVEEGAAMNSAVMSANPTEISLLGMASADIVMTGGGPGRETSQFELNLENVVMC